MHRTILASLALVALAAAAPITEGTKTVEERQIVIPIPTAAGANPKPTFIIFPPITGPIKPSDKRDLAEKRQFSWGDDPSTSWVPQPGGGGVTIGTPITGGLDPADKKRQAIIGGSGDEKAKIVALELEYETLLHEFGTGGPKVVQQRLKAIKDELLKEYGITIVQSPDGTSTTFTPGKRDFIIIPGGVVPGGPIVPENPVPGGPIVPEQPVPGGPIEHST
ncbi:hypothetical protein F5Y17DRAFT_459431 [Xylariaceae sp. FL0594]|nr:hypothetical protein F5Y17DRAFT_459431 [Xylariaceae sp. FL0594]